MASVYRVVGTVNSGKKKGKKEEEVDVLVVHDNDTGIGVVEHTDHILRGKRHGKTHTERLNEIEFKLRSITRLGETGKVVKS